MSNRIVVLACVLEVILWVLYGALVGDLGPRFADGEPSTVFHWYVSNGLMLCWGLMYWLRFRLYHAGHDGVAGEESTVSSAGCSRALFGLCATGAVLLIDSLTWPIT